jgi:hypothetical protein
MINHKATIVTQTKVAFFGIIASASSFGDAIIIALFGNILNVESNKYLVAKVRVGGRIFVYFLPKQL